MELLELVVGWAEAPAEVESDEKDELPEHYLYDGRKEQSIITISYYYIIC